MVVFACFAGKLSAVDPTPLLLRVMTYNIYHGETTDGRRTGDPGSGISGAAIVIGKLQVLILPNANML